MINPFSFSFTLSLFTRYSLQRVELSALLDQYAHLIHLFGNNCWDHLHYMKYWINQKYRIITLFGTVLSPLSLSLSIIYSLARRKVKIITLTKKNIIRKEINGAWIRVAQCIRVFLDCLIHWVIFWAIS